MFRAVALTSGAFLDIADITVTELHSGGQVVVQIRNRGLAPPPSLDVTLTTTSSGVVIDTPAIAVPPPRFGAIHATDPMTFAVSASESAIQLEVTVSGGGQRLVRRITVDVR